jgi:hypothetical protein
MQLARKLPTFGPRMVRTRCGITGTDARPNCTERPLRATLTGAQGARPALNLGKERKVRSTTKVTKRRRPHRGLVHDPPAGARLAPLPLFIEPSLEARRIDVGGGQAGRNG